MTQGPRLSAGANTDRRACNPKPTQSKTPPSPAKHPLPKPPKDFRPTPPINESPLHTTPVAHVTNTTARSQHLFTSRSERSPLRSTLGHDTAQTTLPLGLSTTFYLTARPPSQTSDALERQDELRGSSACAHRCRPYFAQSAMNGHSSRTVLLQTPAVSHLLERPVLPTT